MPLRSSSHVPLSTYRIQLHRKSTFADLGALSSYFETLGISDLYLSPIFTSVPGSLHGYDVTDYSEVNPELGGSGGFSQLASDLRSRGRSILLDFVPNHMGIAGMLNEWWRDVLENGPLSDHAPFFDIQWKTEIGEDHPRILVPILLDHYGKVLEDGGIKLIFDKGFSLQYGETVLPLRPESYGLILGYLGGDPKVAAEAAELSGIARQLTQTLARPQPPAVEGAPPRTPAHQLKDNLASEVAAKPAIRTALDGVLSRLNGRKGDPRSFDALHRVIEDQHYRLARWQAGAHEINYRRFFAIDTLVGLHMENPEVFRECHALVARLLTAGEVCGLRIDHIDGLRQPEDYLERLQSLARPSENKPVYVLAEKILCGDEQLPKTWPVHGTTGYEFITQLSNLLVDPREEERFNRIYQRITGEWRAYSDQVVRSKRLIIAEMFANAVSNMGAELVQILSGDRIWRDLTRHELTTAVSEFAAHLPVYRTYRRRRRPISDEDRLVLETACTLAIADNPRLDPQPLEFLRDLLIGSYPPPGASEEYRALLSGWVLTFQQYTGAIMAKSVEDTVFYTFNRFIALNEVGGSPGKFGGRVAEFHLANAQRLKDTPHTLLTSSTHDSKFSEDVRARLYALCEIGPEWESAVIDWMRIAAPFTSAIEGGSGPDALDQYRFFQILVGAWPLAANEVDDSFRNRLKEYFRKAVNEAKRHTSILNNNEAYLTTCDQYVEKLLAPTAAPDFRAAFEPFANRIARLGMVNSLTQLVVKCTVPGVPDFYQGNEIWDFSLVDPDNRRPVDFSLRQELAAKVAVAPLTILMENWRDGGIKLRITQVLLQLRQQLPLLFSEGGYEPAAAEGSFADQVVGYFRVGPQDTLLVLVPRLTAKMGTPPVGTVWDETRIDGIQGSSDWTDVVTGKTFAAGEPLPLRALFADLPFAVLLRKNPLR